MTKTGFLIYFGIWLIAPNPPIFLKLLLLVLDNNWIPILGPIPDTLIRDTNNSFSKLSLNPYKSCEFSVTLKNVSSKISLDNSGNVLYVFNVMFTYLLFRYI